MSNTSTPDVVEIPGFLGKTEADALLERIRARADFKQNHIQLFGPKKVPRLEAWYGPCDYPYSRGIVLRAAPMPEYLQAVAHLIADAGFGDFDALLINRYCDGHDCINPHSDDDFGDPEPVIASLTLGAARPFCLARVVEGKLDPSTTAKYQPGHGDLLVMKGRTNADWQHWIPRTKQAVGERINLTFRRKK